MGLAVVTELVQKGWNICVMDLNAELEEPLTKRFGDRILFHCGNVVKYEDQGEAFRRTWEKWGQLDLGKC